MTKIFIVLLLESMTAPKKGIVLDALTATANTPRLNNSKGSTEKVYLMICACILFQKHGQLVKTIIGLMDFIVNIEMGSII